MYVWIRGKSIGAGDSSYDSKNRDICYTQQNLMIVAGNKRPGLQGCMQAHMPECIARLDE